MLRLQSEKRRTSLPYQGNRNAWFSKINHIRRESERKFESVLFPDLYASMQLALFSTAWNDSSITLTVPLYTQMFKWLLANLLLWVFGSLNEGLNGRGRGGPFDG